MWYVILRYVINSDFFKEIFMLGKRGVTRHGEDLGRHGEGSVSWARHGGEYFA